jgi:hypothetical protein
MGRAVIGKNQDLKLASLTKSFPIAMERISI